MEVLNYSELRKNLAEHLNTVAESEEVLIVSRGSGKNVVLISLDEYNSLIEIVHLQSSEANAKRLQAAMQEMKTGKFKKGKLKSV